MYGPTNVSLVSTHERGTVNQLSTRLEALVQCNISEINLIRQGNYGFFPQLIPEVGDEEANEALGIALQRVETTLKEIDTWQASHRNEESLFQQVCEELGC